jgi:hypothetical protein
MGPPPWQIAITGARMIDLGKAWPFNVVTRDNWEENSRICARYIARGTRLILRDSLHLATHDTNWKSKLLSCEELTSYE